MVFERSVVAPWEEFTIFVVIAQLFVEQHRLIKVHIEDLVEKGRAAHEFLKHLSHYHTTIIGKAQIDITNTITDKATFALLCTLIARCAWALRTESTEFSSRSEDLLHIAQDFRAVCCVKCRTTKDVSRRPAKFSFIKIALHARHVGRIHEIGFHQKARINVVQRLFDQLAFEDVHTARLVALETVSRIGHGGIHIGRLYHFIGSRITTLQRKEAKQ